MHLTPREVEKPIIFTTREVATRRRARGLKLNHPEPVALIASEVLELIRDGKAVAETMSIWSTLLPLDAVMEGARAGEPNTQMTERQLP
jgi:urease subunit gamma